MALGRQIELAYQRCFAEWRSMGKGGAAVLLTEFEAGTIDRLAGLRSILITYTFTSCGG